MLDLIKFYALKKWIRNLGIPLIAILNIEPLPDPLHTFIILLQLALLQAYSFSLNNYYDAKIRKEKNYIMSLLKHFPSYKILFLCILPLFFLILTFFIYHGNLFLLLLYIIVYDILYEIPPFRFKRNSFYSLLASSLSLAIIPYLYAYLSFSTQFSTRSTTFLFIFFLYMAFHEMIHQMAHSSKEKVLPQRLGLRGGVAIAQTLLLITIASSIIGFVLNPSLNYIFTITIVFSVFRIYKLSKTELKPYVFDKIKKSWHKFYSLHEGGAYIFLLTLLKINFL